MPHKRAKRSVRLAETAKKGSNLSPTSSSYDDAPRSAMRILNSHAVQSAFRAKGLRSSEDTGERKPKPKSKPTSDPTTSISTPTSTSISGDKGKTNGKGKAKEASIPPIMPHETLGEYNRRVESILRPSVSAAIEASNQKKGEMIRDAKRAKEERIRRSQGKGSKNHDNLEVGNEGGGGGGAVGGKRKRAKHDAEDTPREFKGIEGPRRLNDIAEAPPNLPQIRLATKNQSKAVGETKKESVWTAKGKGKSGLSAAQERILGEERDRVIKQYREMKAVREGEREKEREASKGKGGKKRVRDEQEE